MRCRCIHPLRPNLTASSAHQIESQLPLILSSQPLDDLLDIGLKDLNPFWRPQPGLHAEVQMRSKHAGINYR
jgi:hypothetical protein